LAGFAASDEGYSGSIRHHAVTKNGWNRGFLRDAVDGADRYKACKSSTSAYPMDSNDGLSCVFKSNGWL
jgi:hypothetical protein